MDALLPRRLRAKPPSRLGAAMLLLVAAAFASAQAPRFDVRASVQAKPQVPAGGGFELRAKLTPATHALQGGGYSVDAIAAPAASCDGNDWIFVNGFENTSR